jgi:8-oxo-dGTP diphosphatase
MNNSNVIKRYVIRVYAIIINDRDEVLLSDEFNQGMRMTKFPGGGMHFGEGTIDCLKREAIEEFGQEIEVLEHFYTTDYFQPAMFFDDAQLISIYYRARFIEEPRFKISSKTFDYGDEKEGSQSFRWVSLLALNKNDITLPIDKIVTHKLIQESL